MTDGPRQRTDGSEAELGIADLALRILGDVSNLVRSEWTLARAEAKAAFSAAVTGAVALGAALVAALVMLVMLAIAGQHGLMAAGLAPAWAAFAVAAILLVIVLVCVAFGVSRLKKAARVPERTLKNLRRDAETFGFMVERDA